MPSLTHEAILEFFRNDPTLVVALLRDALGVSLPQFTEVELREAELSQVTPTEYRADLVSVLKQDTKPALVVVVEVQLRRDSAKRMTWPIYAATARQRHGCPACVLVVCPDDAVARWCAEPIVVGPGNIFRVLALGPSEVPQITDPDKARAAPELAVLSALTHLHSPEGHRIIAAALQAALGLDPTRASLYHDLVLAGLSPAERARLEDDFMIQGYTYQTEFVKKHIAEGEAKGEAKGKAKGKAEGLAKGKAEAVLTLLDLRELAVTPAQRHLVEACLDISQLDAWFARAFKADSADEVFTDKA